MFHRWGTSPVISPLYRGAVTTQVIILNGGSSSGKSGIARCLQAVLAEQWLMARAVAAGREIARGDRTSGMAAAQVGVLIRSRLPSGSRILTSPPHGICSTATPNSWWWPLVSLILSLALAVRGVVTNVARNGADSGVGRDTRPVTARSH